MATEIQLIWVVDDDPSIRKSLSKSLTKRGYDVRVFESAEIYLSQCTPDQAGCILLDLSMPGMDGLALQKELSSRGITLPIIFISGHGGVPESVKAIKSGAVDFLEKPFEQSLLLDRIEEALTLDRQLRNDASAAQAIQSRFNQLSSRESDVMQLMVSESGRLSSKEIASRLGISSRTVEIHRSRVMEKTGAQSITELIFLAGQLPPPLD